MNSRERYLNALAKVAPHGKPATPKILGQCMNPVCVAWVYEGKALKKDGCLACSAACAVEVDRLQALEGAR